MVGSQYHRNICQDIFLPAVPTLEWIGYRTCYTTYLKRTTGLRSTTCKKVVVILIAILVRILRIILIPVPIVIVKEINETILNNTKEWQ